MEERRLSFEESKQAIGLEPEKTESPAAPALDPIKEESEPKNVQKVETPPKTEQKPEEKPSDQIKN